MIKYIQIAYNLPKQHLLLWYFLLVSVIINAQGSQYNLVPNRSFEQYTICPSGTTSNELRSAKPDTWYKPDLRYAAYLNACAMNGISGVPGNGVGGGSYQSARTGEAYIAMFFYNGADARNYFQVELLESLIQGKCYYGEYYVSLVNTNRIASNNQSMLFTHNPIYVDTNAIPLVELLIANPQIQNAHIITDTFNWVKVSGVFTAQGAEKYLTLGNFHYNSQTATQQIQPSGYNGSIYYIDDVTVIPLDSFPLPADAGPDRTIPTGSSTYVGSYTTGLTGVTWYNSNANVIATGVPGLTVTPTTNTFYVIEQTVCGNYSRDTVYVNVQPLPLQFISYKTSPQPLSNREGQGVLNSWTTANEVNVSHFNIQRSKDGIAFFTVGKAFAKNRSMNEYSFTDQYPHAGVNYYRIESVDKDGKTMYTSIEQIKIDGAVKNIRIYPNPAKDVVTIIEAGDTRKVIITDIAGRMMMNVKLNGSNIVHINITSLNKGIYLVKIIGSDNELKVQKLIVQ